MNIEEIISRRSIQEVLHFTTQQGLTGILHERLVKARNQLLDTESLEFILKINTRNVYDPNWKGFVNLSISRINRTLFGISENWHPDVHWRVLAFDPEILKHDGVQFVTTNNAYWQHLSRGDGPDGLEKLFDGRVLGKYGAPIDRTPDMPLHWTTDVQAEVLYPIELPTMYLTAIYIRTQEESDAVAATMAALGHDTVPILIDQGYF